MYFMYVIPKKYLFDQFDFIFFVAVVLFYASDSTHLYSDRRLNT